MWAKQWIMCGACYQCNTKIEEVNAEWGGLVHITWNNGQVLWETWWLVFSTHLRTMHVHSACSKLAPRAHTLIISLWYNAQLCKHLWWPYYLQCKLLTIHPQFYCRQFRWTFERACQSCCRDEGQVLVWFIYFSPIICCFKWHHSRPFLRDP